MNSEHFGTWEEAVNWLISQPDQQALVQACYYDRPVLDAAKRFFCSEEWRAIRSLLPTPSGRALDVGAGAGISSYALASDGWAVTALEPDGSNLVGAGAIVQLAEEAALPILVVQEFGERMPFPDGAFDIIHARQVLHHARDLIQFCQELFRTLKPGGMLVTTRDHVISNAKQLPEFLARHPLHRYYGGENAFRLSEYRAALNGAGFTIEKILGPFDSVINYAPWSTQQLQAEMRSRLSRWPGCKLLGQLLIAAPLIRPIFWLMSRIDRRPGRLYTFVARRPLN
jgi:SAM-dependent methyltransferase